MLCSTLKCSLLFTAFLKLSIGDAYPESSAAQPVSLPRYCIILMSLQYLDSYIAYIQSSTCMFIALLHASYRGTSKTVNYCHHAL